MMKIGHLLVVASSVIFFISCGKNGVATPSPVDGNSAEQSKVGATQARIAVQGDSVAIDYVLTLGDGTVFDTTIPGESKASKKYDPRKKYSPLLIRIGSRTMPKGLEDGIIGMSAGEKKKIVVSPMDAYGENYSEISMPKRLFEDVYEETYSVSKFQDSFESVVTDTELAAQGRKVSKIGDEFTSGGVTSKVTKIQSGLITLLVDNKKNPFYGKRLEPGVRGMDDGNMFTVKKVEGGNVTVSVDNLSNPFKGKKLEKGASALMGGEMLTVMEIEGEQVKMRKGHELAGKTLTYDVILREFR